MVDEAIKDRPHHINGRQMLIKRAVLIEEAGSPTVGASIQKLFIKDIEDKPIAEEDLDKYFGKYLRKNQTV
jgi:heterogeneous nuclear ribonucleoprotein A1/A3